MTTFQKGVTSFPQYAAGASLLFNSKKVSLLPGKEKKKKNVCQEITEYISEIIKGLTKKVKQRILFPLDFYDL